VVRTLALLLLICILTALPAERSDTSWGAEGKRPYESAEPIPSGELIELELEDLQGSWWQDLLAPLEAAKDVRIHFRNRLTLPDLSNPDQFTVSSALRLSYPRFVLFASRRQTDSDGLTAVSYAALFRSGRGLLRKLQIGDYGVTFAQGICSRGSISAPAGSSSYALTPPGDPNRYQMHGMAAEIVRDSVNILAFASQLPRTVTLSDGRITHLYHSPTENTHLTVNESIAGLVIASRIRNTGLGMLCYVQDYDREFADSLTIIPAFALSVHAGYKGRNISTSSEIALLDACLPAFKSLLEYRTRHFRQSIGIVYYPDAQFPAYAGRPFLLRNDAARQELQYDMEIKLTDRMDLSFRTAHNRAERIADHPRWLDRQVITGDWKTRDSIIRLSFIRYDRHLVTVDDLPVESAPTTGQAVVMQQTGGNRASFRMPTNDRYRTRLFARYRITARWQNQLTCVYDLEHGSNFRRNGVIIDNRFLYRHKTHRLSFGIKTWHTQNAIYDYSPDDDNSLPYSHYLNKNLNLYAAFSTTFRYGDLSLRAEQELHRDRRTRIYTGFTLSF